MTLDQFIQSRITAIKANFSRRNTCVASVVRMENIKYQRRAEIRRLIAELRLATHPSQHTREIIADRVKWMAA